MPKKIIVYAHEFCPQVAPVLGMLKQSKIDYDYINIHKNAEAQIFVRNLNDGYESVPTLIFPDGTSLTEPSSGALRNKLQALGYKVSIISYLIGNLHLIITGVIVLYGVLNFLEVI